MNGQLKLFTGNANPELARKIGQFLKVPLGRALVTTFSEGEIRVKIDEDVRGRDVFIVQPTCPPTNNNLMELLIMIDALKRASAWRITAVIPYFGYARQDRKDQPRVPISAKLIANLLTVSGTDRVLTMDLHASQIQGFFDIPLDHLFAVNVLVDHFKKKKIKDLVVASPDVGGIKMARAYAKRLGAHFAIVDKRRIDDRHAEVMNILGDVKGKNIVIVDDLVATASSICEAAAALKKAGAKTIYATVSHAVLSGPAVERIQKSAIEEFVVSDSVPLDPSKKNKKIKALSVAPLLGEAIKRIHNEESVSSLFN
ncbi:MAG: phosphoribosylpyrophosphate synthetase [Omnitrophica bacterium RIFCSPHIGHO2_02_FULL_63_14]|nr:MAG: phosphoribosylpyrophosphate synthetase [Omnitrophica bacterium RIFCSPHIGHO2_02_FULL_63_14]